MRERMSNYKCQITNESRSSVMGVDECLNLNDKLRIRNTNHGYVFLFSTSYFLLFTYNL